MQSLSCLKTWPIHRCFLCQTEFSICLSSFTLLRTSSLVSLSNQLIFSILLHIHISNASNILSICEEVKKIVSFNVMYHRLKKGWQHDVSDLSNVLCLFLCLRPGALRHDAV